MSVLIRLVLTEGIALRAVVLRVAVLARAWAVLRGAARLADVLAIAAFFAAERLLTVLLGAALRLSTAAFGAAFLAIALLRFTVLAADARAVVFGAVRRLAVRALVLFLTAVERLGAGFALAAAFGAAFLAIVLLRFTVLAADARAVVFGAVRRLAVRALVLFLAAVDRLGAALALVLAGVALLFLGAARRALTAFFAAAAAFPVRLGAAFALLLAFFAAGAAFGVALLAAFLAFFAGLAGDVIVFFFVAVPAQGGAAPFTFDSTWVATAINTLRNGFHHRLNSLKS